MAAGDEVRDPWTYVAGGLAGGLAWALGIFPPAAIAIGAAVLGVKIAVGAANRAPRRDPHDRRLPVLTRTPEAAWLARAGKAQRTFGDIARSARGGPIAERVVSFGDEVAQAMGALERLAGQASTIRTAMARMDPKALAWERDRLSRAAGSREDPRILAERERALGSVHAQLETYGRLTTTLATLLARLESGTLAIEGLVARLAEVVALAETSTAVADEVAQVDELAMELEGLRAGLVEAESVTTRAMQGLTAPGSVAANERRRARG
jgi:hypothetical protein